MAQGEGLVETRIPAMKYVFTIESGYALEEPARTALVRAWMEERPHASYALLIPAKAFLGEESLGCKWGFALEAEGLENCERGIAEHYPAAECVAFSFIRERADMIRPEELGALRSRFAATGLKLAGDLRGSFLEILGTQDNPRYLYRIYLPIYR